jgi:hypothetical protein
MSKRSNKNECSPGKIMRKGYSRKQYQKKNGTIISKTYVPSACVKDMGKPGKGPKTLPKPDNLVHLSKYGYSIHKSEKQRRTALQAAVKDYDTLLILRRLNLLRNFQAVPKNKEIFSKDVDYMKQLYSNIRKSRPHKNYNMDSNELNNEWNSNWKNSKIRKNQLGGNDSLFQDPMISEITDTSITSDNVVNNIKLPESKTVEINKIIDQEKMCDADGNCGVRNNIYEEHIVDDKHVLFYTLGKTDVDQILELDKKYLDSDIDSQTVMQKIINNPGLFIGIKIDNILEGYCHYEPLENLEVMIVWFCANKGFGTPLYLFMEKYFRMNDYTRIILVVSLEGSYSTRRINFWYSMGFLTYETHPEKKKVHMEKFI